MARRHRGGRRGGQRATWPRRSASPAGRGPSRCRRAGPAANARCRRTFARWRSKRSGSGNSAGSRLAPVSDTSTSVAGGDHRAGHGHVARRVPVDDSRRRFHPQRLLDRGGHERGPAGDLGPRPGVAEQQPQGVEDHPLGRLDPTEHDHRGVGDDLGVVEPAVDVGEVTLHGAGQLGHRPLPRRRRRPALADAGHRSHDVAVPGQQAGDGPRVRAVEAEALGHDSRGERPGQLGPQLGPLAERAHQPARLGLDERLEALGDLARTVRRDVRVAMTGVGRRRRVTACSGRRREPSRTAGRRP